MHEGTCVCVTKEIYVDIASITKAHDEHPKMKGPMKILQRQKIRSSLHACALS